jgi:WD40 repeat protein
LYSCISIGTKVGFKIFATDQFQLFYESKCGPINIVEMLYTYNLVFLVGLNDFGEFSPKKVTIWSTTTNSVLCSSWQFLSKINIVKINKKSMVICERNFMHVYSAKNMKIQHTFDCGQVLIGKLVLSSNPDNNIVCFSSNKDQGVVRVYDLNFLNYKTNIVAHKSPVLKMAISYNGDILLTCSCKGTSINVFSLPKGEQIASYKRGINSAYIFWLGFSLTQEKIIVTSDTGTINIFDLGKDKEM